MNYRDASLNNLSHLDNSQPIRSIKKWPFARLKKQATLKLALKMPVRQSQLLFSGAGIWSLFCIF